MTHTAKSRRRYKEASALTTEVAVTFAARSTFFAFFSVLLILLFRLQQSLLFIDWHPKFEVNNFFLFHL
jgi:uncharacterized membrane protein